MYSFVKWEKVPALQNCKDQRVCVCVCVCEARELIAVTIRIKLTVWDRF